MIDYSARRVIGFTVETQEHPLAGPAVDAGVGNRAEEDLQSVPRQVVAVGSLNQSSVAVLDHVVRGGRVAQQGSRVPHGTRERRPHPVIQWIRQMDTAPYPASIGLHHNNGKDWRSVTLLK